VTFSIVGFDASNGDLGVVVASKFPAVGVVVPWARAGVGAVATQAWARTSYGPEGLTLMERSNCSAPVALERLVEADDGRDHRQVGMVDAAGRAVTFTGGSCMEWAGGRSGEGYAAQGNILAGPEVVDAMCRAYEGAAGDLVDRLLAGVAAGDGAGGDRRGRQSAALLVVRSAGGYEGYTDRYVDLRVDDHPQAPSELARVFEAYDRDILIRNDAQLDAGADLVADLQRRLARLGRFAGQADGTYDDATREAIAGFAGEYNLEGRLRDDHRISETLVREIRDVTPD
jgi:uncharacterized Ntn-hydrolase superfamily protein